MKFFLTGLIAILAITLSACDTLTNLTTASNNKPVTNSFDYSPAKISFVKLDIKESNGNGDEIPNRGESIYITPYFKNSGGVNSNSLEIVATSNSEFVEITHIKDSIEALKPNETKKVKSNYLYPITIKVSKTIPSGTEIQLLFKLSDDFGNEYETTGSFTIQ